MLAAPRRSDAVPNPTGVGTASFLNSSNNADHVQEWAVFSETSYSWDEHVTATQWNLLEVSSSKTSLLFNGSDVSEIFWIGPKHTSILYINGTNDAVAGGVTIYSADAKNPTKA